jgi:hypothetical protein
VWTCCPRAVCGLNTLLYFCSSVKLAISKKLSVSAKQGQQRTMLSLWAGPSTLRNHWVHKDRVHLPTNKLAKCILMLNKLLYSVGWGGLKLQKICQVLKSNDNNNTSVIQSTKRVKLIIYKLF